MIPSSVTKKESENNTKTKEICKLNKDILGRRTTISKQQKKSTGIYCDFLSSRNFKG